MAIDRPCLIDRGFFGRHWLNCQETVRDGCASAACIVVDHRHLLRPRTRQLKHRARRTMVREPERLRASPQSNAAAAPANKRMRAPRRWGERKLLRATPFLFCIIWRDANPAAAATARKQEHRQLVTPRSAPGRLSAESATTIRVRRARTRCELSGVCFFRVVRGGAPAEAIHTVFSRPRMWTECCYQVHQQHGLPLCRAGAPLLTRIDLISVLFSEGSHSSTQTLKKSSSSVSPGKWLRPQPNGAARKAALVARCDVKRLVRSAATRSDAKARA